MENSKSPFNFASGAKEAALGVGKVLGGAAVAAYGVCHGIGSCIHLSADFGYVSNGFSLIGEGCSEIAYGSSEMIKSFKSAPATPENT